MKSSNRSLNLLRLIGHSILIVVITMQSTVLSAGHFVGNGGDHVRATFIKAGLAVIDLLENTEQGQAIVRSHRLSTQDLQRVLDINVIEVRDEVLIDNGGSVVDAIGESGKILLSKDRWVSHFEQDRDVYFLVLHEMLRAVAVNDDNYIISNGVNPFPATRKIITRLTTKFPILGEVSLDTLIPVERIILDGNGCPKTLAGTFVDFDLEKNLLNVGLQRFDINLIEATAGRKACNVLIPVNPPVGKRVIITQMDFSAKVTADVGTKASIASRASFAAHAIAPQIKSIEASELTQGKLLIRTHQTVSSNCIGQAEILRISAVGGIQKPDRPSAKVEQLIADQISVSFAIESCSR